MEMVGFKITNYKKINDSEWIPCDKITAFVGKNESGKSALFRGLSKINPSDEEKYNGLKEFPRKRYTSEFKLHDWCVATVEFKLNDIEKEQITNICQILKDVNSIICTRYYSWDLSIEFKSYNNISTIDIPNISNKAYLEMLNNLEGILSNLIAPDGKGDLLGKIQKDLNQMIKDKILYISKQSPDQILLKSEIDSLLFNFTSSANEQWIKEILTPSIDIINIFIEKIIQNEQIINAKIWIKENIPKFIYFDTYNIIESAINIELFNTQYINDQKNPRLRATKCLFDQVGLDLNKIVILDPNQQHIDEKSLRDMADERAIQMSSASSSMTDMFSHWWMQRKHKFRYQIDGKFFRIWVSDDLDSSEIELDQRSKGLQYFFSFYLIFLVEAVNKHKNSILLLDEPGIYIHGNAQKKLIDFFEKLSNENQILYTTHSPFMIDGEHIERVRVVYESDDGTTKVNTDIWPKDSDALFPLQAALGYSIAQSLFYSKKQIIVEGLTDYIIFKAINQKLIEKGMTRLDDDIVLLPSGGTTNLMPLASMLKGHNIKIIAILDGDVAGRSKGRSLQDKLFEGNGKKCIFLGDYINNFEEAEIEDLFPVDFYMKAIKEHYNIDIIFTDEENKIKNITKRVASSFNRLGYGKFEKWYIANIIIRWISTEKEFIPEDTLKLFSKIFVDVNKLIV